MIASDLQSPYSAHCTVDSVPSPLQSHTLQFQASTVFCTSVYILKTIAPMLHIAKSHHCSALYYTMIHIVQSPYSVHCTANCNVQKLNSINKQLHTFVQGNRIHQAVLLHTHYTALGTVFKSYSTLHCLILSILF